MEERAQEPALYIIENKAAVRAAAARFGISKSTVHTVIIKQYDFGEKLLEHKGKRPVSDLTLVFLRKTVHSLL